MNCFTRRFGGFAGALRRALKPFFCLLFLGVYAIFTLLFVGCSSQAVVDEDSPRCIGVQISAGSDQTEGSQYVEVRLEFDTQLEDASDVADDFRLTLNGSDIDTNTMQVEAYVQGSEVVVRLVPTSAADGSNSSLYYALYDGLICLEAASDTGGLARVRAAEGTSNAVLEDVVEFTTPSGMQLSLVDSGIGDTAEGQAAWVSFDIVQYAQLRTCAWFWFSDDLPIVMMHNHEFLRDLPETAAERLVETINELYGEDLEASCDGARVTVWAKQVVDGQELGASLCEGLGANPASGVAGLGVLSEQFGDSAQGEGV